jgi:hypothetical protein
MTMPASSMKAKSPRTACRVTSAPQLAPMNDEVTSLRSTSYASARAITSSSASACSSCSVCTRTPESPTTVTRAEVPGAISSTAAAAGSCDASATFVIWNCEPPRNSMPKLNPRKTMMSAERISSTAAIVYHFRRPPTKLNERLPV